MEIVMPFWIFILLCALSILGSIGNAFIIGAVCLQKRLRVRGNAFIINLAVADLIVTAYIMPIGLATAWYRQAPFGPTLCDINAFLIMCTCGVSTQTLMMVAVERYVSICKMHCYQRLFNVKTIAVYITLCWVYAALWTAQGWTGWTKYVYGKDIFMCLFDGTYSLSYDLCIVAFGMVLPMSVLLLSYTMIFRTVWKSRAHLKAHRKAAMRNTSGTKQRSTATGGSSSMTKEQKRVRREAQLVCTLFTIVLLFIVSWALAAVVLPMSALWEEMPSVLYTIAVWVALCNSTVNTIIYGAMNKNFRAGYRMFFTRCFCLTSCKTHCSNIENIGRISSDQPSSNQEEISPDTSLSQIQINSSRQFSSPWSLHSNYRTGITSSDLPNNSLSDMNSIVPSSSTHQIGDHIESDNTWRIDEESATDEDATQNSRSYFVQYVHLDEDDHTDFYSSPVLGATKVLPNGSVETPL